MHMLAALWRLLDRPQRRRLIALQLLSILMAFSTVGGIAAVVPFFTALADPAAIERSAALHRVFQSLNFASEASFLVALGVGFSAAILVANAVNLFGQLALTRFAYDVGDSLYIRMFDGYMRSDYAFHLRNNSAVLATRVLHDTARVTSGILQQVLIVVTNLVTIVCIVAAIVLLNPLIACAALVALGASYAAIYIGTRGRLLRNGRAGSRYDAARTTTVNESFGAIKELLLTQGRELFVARFARQCREISRTIFSTFAIAQSPRYILECLTVVCLVGVALFFRSRTDSSGPWVAHLTFIGFAAYRLLPALQQLFAAIVRIRAEQPAFAALRADMETVRRQQTAVPSAVRLREWQGKPRSEIRLREVSFRYSPDRAAAIANISLTIPAGSVVGFMGPNGSGKTTLVDLVSGLLAPQSGTVEVDGVPLDRDTRPAWQSTIAYVPQHAFLLDASLAENVALGVAVEQIDLHRVELAVQGARLAECVAALPHGLQEHLGERGSRLSGGERQRLAIARALYRDASVLILDEATSALDTGAESEIVEALNALRTGRTVLVIAHRTTSLRYCDLLFELNAGRVVRSGTYGQLTALSRSLARSR